MSDGEELPGIVPAIYVGIDKVGTGKGWSGEEWEFGDYHHYGGGFPAAVFVWRHHCVHHLDAQAGALCA